MEEDILFFIAFCIVGIFAFAIYFLPTFFAFSNNHSHKYAIMLLNIIMGASGFGWIAAFIWAFCDNKK